jgi:hypothetical protein
MFLLIHLEEPYANFLRSAEWKELSLRVIQRAGGVCECCGVNPAVSAHHRDYRFESLVEFIFSETDENS